MKYKRKSKRSFQWIASEYATCEQHLYFQRLLIRLKLFVFDPIGSLWTGGSFSCFKAHVNNLTLIPLQYRVYSYKLYKTQILSTGNYFTNCTLRTIFCPPDHLSWLTSQKVSRDLRRHASQCVESKRHPLFLQDHCRFVCHLHDMAIRKKIVAKLHSLIIWLQSNSLHMTLWWEPT